MATYAIGDIQGCFQTFERLLERIEFSPRRDRLWLVGDLVNRGPQSLEVLRWARAHDGSALTVLGNHDVALLKSAAGLRREKPRDTLSPILNAPDRDVLLDWLRRQPLIRRERDHLILHAGLLPAWTPAEALRRARAAEDALARDDWIEALAPPFRGRERDRRELEEIDETIEVLTTLRLVDGKGRLRDDFSGPPEQAPRGTTPWFAAPGRRTADVTVVFGHWAALGLRIRPKLIALDSGCVWGRSLSAVRIEDREVFQEPCRDPLPPGTGE